MRLTRWIVAAVAMMVSLPGCAKTPSATYKGAYVTSPNLREGDSVSNDMNLVQPAASGTFIRIAWRAFEPQQRRYDWRLFDSVVLPAIAAGKNLSVGVIAGIYAPAWVGDVAGAKFSTFTIEQRGCVPGRLYHPWDLTYQNAYLDMMRAIKQHLVSIKGYDALKIVKMSYIAQQTLELQLPRRPAGVYRNCQKEDSRQTWIAAGYKPSLVLKSYDRVIKVLAQDIFPDKIISQPTQRGGAFPDIGENSTIVADGVADTPLVASIVKSCIEAAGARCAIQNQSLQMVGDMGDRVLAARQSGAKIGWQTAMFQGRARCVPDDAIAANMHLRHPRRAPKSLCNERQYGQLLSRAVAAGATYLELWPADVRDFPAVVTRINAELQAN